jgi:hypothetical protein
MRTITAILVLSLSACAFSLSAFGADNARTTIPDCGAASVRIFNGPEFDGTIYLHETDARVSRAVVRTVRQISARGQTPAVCSVNGIASAIVSE